MGVLLLLFATITLFYAFRTFMASVAAGGGGGGDKSSARKMWRFEDFLVDGSVPAGGGGAASGDGDGADGPLSEADAAAQLERQVFEFASDGGAPVLLLYGTEYGFSREVAHKLAEELQRSSGGAVSPRVLNMMHFQLLDWARERTALVVCSTTGDGVVPNDARPFADQIESGALTVPSGVRYSVLALGDRGYPHFCRAGRTFDELFAAGGAHRMAARVEVDQEDWGEIDHWFATIKQQQQQQQLGDGGVANGNAPAPAPAHDYLRANIAAGGALIAELANDVARKYTRDTPYHAAVTAKRPISSTGRPDDKETVHVEFNLGDSGMTYTPGDALGVVPTNCPDEVQRTLEALRMRGTEQADVGVSVRDFLARRADLKNLRRDLLLAMAEAAVDEGEGARARALCPVAAGAGDAEANRQLDAYLDEREFSDVLRDFPSARFKPSRLPQLLKLLQPRFYSISSSPTAHGAATVSATVAVVRYRSLGAARKGVATCYLADRVRAHDTVPVFLSRNPAFRLPDDASRHVLMIGPGTGVAPFRAFVAERRLRQGTGRTVLYFGSRYRERDFLYRDEFEALHRDGHVELVTAFSREQAEKVYVQHRLMENGADVYALMEDGAHVYVCGDALRMARDVDAALRAILRAHGGMAAAAAEAYMQRLERERRYQRDVWVE